MFEDTTFKRGAARRTGMQRRSTTESTPELSRLCTLRAGRSGAQITVIIAGLQLRSPFAHNRLAMIAFVWLRTKVIQRCLGSAGRLGFVGMYRRIVGFPKQAELNRTCSELKV